MIKIHELEKSFKDVSVLKGVSITIKDSEIYGIVGQSGAGKSTLLRCINGLESFESGYVEVDGT
ncbi:MAG: ATP-binding cassette domain-containing protein, partial [Lachnospiraceae bacterium]|nr:ATP-binding cassette domain-containing protein [Lachnospiraceae bacterium]